MQTRSLITKDSPQSCIVLINCSDSRLCVINLTKKLAADLTVGCSGTLKADVAANKTKH